MEPAHKRVQWQGANSDGIIAAVVTAVVWGK
jgi:hypothetical protein